MCIRDSCEGERTEPEYLDALRREPAVHDVAAVDINIDWTTTGSVPMTLVTAAVAARKKADVEEGEIDEVWCIFDVEWPINHPQLAEAIDLAQRSGVHVAVSNPCFEVWLALHFTDFARWLDNSQARKRRRELDSTIDKGVDGATYMARRAFAVARAQSLEAKHITDGTEFPHDNPSSSMYRFLQAVEGT